MGARVAVTGAGGFIGSHLVRGFDARGANVLPIVRAVNDKSPADARAMRDAIADVDALRGVDVLVH
ncbi:MAG: NAD-dependent epimerase/dehydratase family protein, partial [Polyangiaceae bacterium]|nr:NAD-dependent epimerase/dehydratase family protein [Polyangiaceae bacterium]